ncbi:MAG TPA: hypothetical protein VLD16_14775 [Gaiellaceae bacterium]|nr:hypothetical protein [Gaiellaceae bacterium]
MRRALAATALAAALAPAVAHADTQQVLLPGPTPYPTPSPPLATTAPTVGATLTFRIRASSEQRVTAGVADDGSVVAVRALQKLRLTGTGDYLIVVQAPVLDVRAAAGSQSQPGQRRGQILWAGFASRRRLLSAQATLRPGPVLPFLPLRLRASRDGDRYMLTLANATTTSEVAFHGAASRAELASLLDRTRRESLAGRRLTPVYATIAGPVSQRPQKPRIAAPLRVTGELRFPRAPSAAAGGVVDGHSVRFSFVLGDEQPLARRVEVTGGGGAPRLHVEARPAAVVRGLRPPAGAASWRSTRLPPAALLRTLIDTRMQLVRSDQYQAFLANPDPVGRNRTSYVYETAAVRHRAPLAGSSGGGSGTLVILLAIVGAIVAAGAGLIAWAHS